MDEKPKQRIVRNIKTLRRKRIRPVCKWKSLEVNLLIKYLMENRNFEKPSQRIYYQMFIRQYGIDIPWDLIKGKVRYLRLKYEKLRDLYRSNDQSEFNKRQISGIERSCPYFNKLAMIFEDKRLVPIKDEISWETDNSMSQNQSIDQHCEATGSTETFGMVQIPIDQSVKNSISPIQLQQPLTIENVIENYCNPIEEPIPIFDRNSHNDFNMLKLEFEKEKFARRMALSEKKFEFKMESARKRFELKSTKLELEKMNVEKDLQLEKLRLEIDERIMLKKLEVQQRVADTEM